MLQSDTPRPEITIVCQPAYRQTAERIALGIEEENVPFAIAYTPPGEAVARAYSAAQTSRLGVGICADESIVLHFVKLSPDSPLFKIRYTSDDDVLRAVGANAARLVKRMPFKALGEA